MAMGDGGRLRWLMFARRREGAEIFSVAHLRRVFKVNAAWPAWISDEGMMMRLCAEARCYAVGRSFG